jgi:hypothetical protein
MRVMMREQTAGSGGFPVSIFIGLALALAGCSPPAVGPTPTSPVPADAIVAEVASFELVANKPGRLLVALITSDNRWLSFGTVDLRFTYLGDAAASGPAGISADNTTGRFLAIPGSPEGVGRQPTLTPPADGHGVYAAEPITLPRAGYWQVVAAGRLADGAAFEAGAAFTVRERSSIPSIGDLAPRTENPVIGTPGIEPAAIDSRATGTGTIPDPELHRTSIATAIEQGHPALVVFSTPVYCVSRFCGPVTDLVAQLAAEYGDRADFIHVEIYTDFEAGEVSSAAREWLTSDDGELREPWTFLVDANGRIVGSWDTVVTRSELEPLLASLPVK